MYNEIDTQHALETIKLLASQCEQAWKEASHIDLPASYKEVTAIVVTGMGASWIGAHIIQNVFKNELKIPFIIVHDYSLPAFVNENTLVIASSYSGTTEETVAILQEASNKKAKIITISSGGDLDEIAKTNSLPHYTFNPTYNPAKSPRLGLGYSLTALLALLSQLGFITVENDEMNVIIENLKKSLTALLSVNENNPAQKMANAFFQYIPVIVSGPFLLGNAHLFSNQFNETAKTFATYMQIPELNHHLMEGLGHPQSNTKLKFLFLESTLEDERNQKRIEVTKEVVAKNSITYESYISQGATKLMQAFNLILFGSLVTFYLAMSYKENPTPNPWVDYFKKRLKELH